MKNSVFSGGEASSSAPNEGQQLQEGEASNPPPASPAANDT